MTEEVLYNNWVRSYEEDTTSSIVFRPETYDFPLRRGGREAIAFRNDNSFVFRESSADDRYQENSGKWYLEDEKYLCLDRPCFLQSKRHQIEILTPDILVLIT